MRPTLHLANLRGVFGDPEGAQFALVASERIFRDIDLAGSDAYSSTTFITADGEDAVRRISGLEGRYHVLAITSDLPFASPPPGAVTKVKLGVLPLFSTGYSSEKLRRALDLIQQADYIAQARSAEKILAHLMRSSNADLLSAGATATLQLRGCSQPIYFFNQSGPLAWGRQSVLPAGEVSLLTDAHGRYSVDSTFKLNGSIRLRGYPVVHRGSCPCSFAKSLYLTGGVAESSCPVVRQQYVDEVELLSLFHKLEPLRTSDAIAEVRDGHIVALNPGRSDSFGAALEAIFDEDRRYRKIHEIGIGLLDASDWFMHEDFLPNEMRSGVHLGLGLTPYTKFHIDLVLPNASFANAGHKPGEAS